MNKTEIRNYFPYLKTGKLYFNHAAISPLSTKVLERVNSYLSIRSEGEIEPYFETLDEALGAKQKVADLLKVASDDIAWTSNVSHSLNILAQGLSWQKDDEIILNDIEFPSNVYPFLNLKTQGVNVKFAKSVRGKVDLEDIEKLVTSKTKLISISMVQFLTGYRANLESIGEFCKDKNIIFCVDGIQGVGALDIDLQKCNIDFFAGGTHKWLMALQGLGYAYISKNLLGMIESKHVGWTSVKNPWELTDYNLSLLESSEKFQLGTLPRLNIIALNASLGLLNEFGINNVEQNILENTRYLRNQLNNLPIELVCEDLDNKNLSGITTFRIENSKIIYQKLKEKNIECSLREGMIRVSPHFYNTIEEIDLLIDELKQGIKK